MCQAAPLPRCSNHSLKAKADIEQTIADNNEKSLELSQALVSSKRQARLDGFTNEQIMAGDTPGLEHIQKIREDHAALEREQMKLGRDIAEQELHLDATPRGKKALEEDENAPFRGFRLKNVNALNDWHKRLRETNDSNGIRIVDKESNTEERRAFLGEELVKARDDYNNAVAAMKDADTRRENLNDEAAEIGARSVGLGDPQGRRFGTWVAKDGASKEEQEEVDYLSRRKSSAMTALQQSHHDQILARAKISSIKKAFEEEKKRQAKKNATKDEPAKDAAYYSKIEAENKVKAQSKIEDLKALHLKLTNDAKADTNGDMGESIMRSARASAVGDGLRLLETYREMNRGNEARAFAQFREDLTQRKAEALAEGGKATSSTDWSMYSGVNSGFALVLNRAEGI